ncbi:MAG: hypothetical protein E7326_08160 [Clostridiales bacterium]|nr:hypothetical protein [Clostridiales bacterium]
MNAQDIHAMIKRAEEDCKNVFSALEENEMLQTKRVLSAFQDESVAARHFAPSTGYGYDDIGRDTLERIFASLFGAESAIVRPHIVSGTAALSLCLFGLLLPGDHLLSATGTPYDTMQTVIGLTGNGVGSLKEMGIEYSQVEMTEDGRLDTAGVLAAIRENTKVVMIQRSRGYAWRASLTPDDMQELIHAIHRQHPHVFVMVDNCYGEFICHNEPTHVGADVVVGSLIKNLGGGLAPTGGYLCGTQKAIERIETRLTAPGIGREEGSYAASYRPFYQGLFMAPHVVTQALKTATLAARVFELLGMKSTPAYDAPRSDIIQAIQMNDPDRLIAFCQGIQAASPIDANAVPEPWDMPGYTDQVIMAAGTFVSGASIELSADAPMRAPFIAYLQGGLTYIHGKLALERSLSLMVERNLI